MDSFLLKIADWHNEILRKKGLINDKNYSDIDMIFRGNLYNLLVMTAFLTFSWAFGCFYEMLVMFLSFNIIRNFCGGWHSYGDLNFCLLVSYLVFSISISISLVAYSLYPFWIILAIISMLYIFVKAPYDQPEKEYMAYEAKFDSLMMTILFLLLSLLFNNIGLHSCATCILFAIIFSALFMNKTICRVLEVLK